MLPATHLACCSHAGITMAHVSTSLACELTGTNEPPIAQQLARLGS